MMTTDPIHIAKKSLLEPAGLSDQQLERILGEIMKQGADAADLYFQASFHESWVLEEGILKEGSYNTSRGVGVRALSGEKTGFAYSDDIQLSALTQAAHAARSIALHGGKNAVNIARPVKAHLLYPAINPLQSLTETDKVALLRSLDQKARLIDPRVKQVIASLSGVYDVVFIAGSDGTFAADLRPLVRANVTVIVEQAGRTETASFGGGGRDAYTAFFNEKTIEHYAREAVRQALVALEARPAPAGTMPVVLGPGWPGVLLHEAIGHGLEGDFNRKKTSAFSGRLGERVANTCCTVVDDGTLAHRRGSLNMDDEGTITQCTVLIEKGILKNYMQDKQNARLMKMTPTGNGRRESYAHLPMPRMTNTYMLAGESDPKEIIASIDKGLYAVNFGGGQVDITSGKFVFSASEAYWVENGKILYPVKGATLIGNGPDVLNRVSMVGTDLALDSGVGVCGKDGQSVPVGVGQPTLRIDSLTVGGTQTS
ncbi:MAG: tldD protein [Gammaproteobacteria bacterium]|jgi:TldD protein|nr:tldD protein [Gammaproteobacteria bacterium]